MEFQIIGSNKGGEKMIRDGNMYVIKRRNGRRVSWECVKRRVNGCKARASTDLQFNDATFFHAHCHTPDYVNVSVTKAKASIKEHAANSNEHPAGGLQKIRNGDPFREMYVKSEMDKSR